MFPLALTLSTLSLLVLAAHFLRGGNLFGCLGALVVAGLLLFSRKRWALRATQVVLVLGAVLWSFATNGMVRSRIAEGGPAGRLVGIMGSVIALDILSAVLLGTRRVRDRYPAPPPPGPSAS